MFTQLLEKIKEYDTIVIHRHSNPDGDALGSQIGLKNIITENFPEKTVYIVGDMTARYAFMEGAVMDEIEDSVYENALAIVLDTSAAALISDERYRSAKATARMDHHIFCEKICDVELTDTSFESCCGLITEFAVATGLRLNSLAAKSLYTGMVTDSGRFRYDSTTSKTFRLASRLLEEKFDTNEIYSGLYADDFEHVKLRAEFILKIRFTTENVGYIYTTLDEMKSYGVSTFTISRGMVGTMGDLRGVDIWVNFTETDDGVLAELRSSKYNINPIAVKYGGGGHQKASGATLKNREEAMAMLDDLDNIIKENAK
ncbi:MAG: bifunctional oligoribonuclease/PAP phosphatase NrnA [Clostridia bacterium]|nr:bifunctional oligoribonuclease/PAP phosphatase NrnA [Clostridia bacterium]